MDAKQINNRTTTVSPRWMSLATAATYTGLSEQTLRNWSRAGHLKLCNVMPMGNRGRVLIDRYELDAFIERYSGAGPAQIVMNTSGKQHIKQKGASRA